MLQRASAIVVAASITVMTAGPAAADEFTGPNSYGTIEVEDQGHGPLHTLRYDWTVGDSRSVRFTITRAETTAIDGQPVAQIGDKPLRHRCGGDGDIGVR